MMFAVLRMYVFCFFAITVCGVTVNYIDEFYEYVSTTMSVSLDPRDYIVPPTVDQTNAYHYLNQRQMMMISEITIFFYKDMLTAPVELSLSFSRAPDFQATFTIHAEYATIRFNNDDIIKSPNFVREDGKMMRFYACFVGRFCRMNAVNLPYPMDKFKIETDDSHSLLRIFIKSFDIDKDTDGLYRDHRAQPYYGDFFAMVYHDYDTLTVCNVERGKYILKTFFPESFRHGLNPLNNRVPLKIESPENPQIIVFSMRFALFMIINDLDEVEDTKYKLLIAEEFPKNLKLFRIRFVGFRRIICMTHIL